MKSIGSTSVALLTATLGGLIVCGIGLGQVVINEVEINPADNGSMWVELYNTGDQPVDIGGWKVSIKSEPWLGVRTIPEGTQIQANGFNVVEGDSRWTPVYNATVLLEDSQGAKIDQTPLLSDMSQNDFTYSRITGHWDSDIRADWAWTMATKGKPNSV
jgi:hypothetical protein